MPPSSNYTKSWAQDGQIAHVSLSSGQRLRFLKSGNGPPLVLMHTLRTQLDYFHRLIPLLTSQYTVYAIDLPGMGWSDIRPNTDYSESAIRRDMIEFIDSLGLTDIYLGGESMGATLALTIAREMGHRIRRVVALNTYDYPRGVERANIVASVVIKTMRIPVIGQVVASLENTLILSKILRGGFCDASRLPRDFVRELIRSGRRGGYAKVETAYLHTLKTLIEARQSYQRIEVPVTLVYGDHDWSKPEERREVAGLVRESEFITLAGTGHFASLEKPEDVAKIFLRAAATGDEQKLLH